MKSKHLLFLCTGNYYRSRFAELLFNHLAPRHGLSWFAGSRGLALELGAHNVGPIAADTIAGLAARGISLEGKTRSPLALIEADLVAADHIVALKQAEHFPLIQHHFPRWVERVEFWHVHDRDFALPKDTLADIERNVLELIGRLEVKEPFTPAITRAR